MVLKDKKAATIGTYSEIAEAGYNLNEIIAFNKLLQRVGS